MSAFCASMFLLLLISLVASQCTYTQTYWIDASVRLNLTDKLCGIEWAQLLRIDPSRMIIQANAPWIVAFHQYASAVLNQRRTNLTTRKLNQAIAALGYSLEMACHNLSQWQSPPGAITLLYQFNHGQFNGTMLACQDEFNDVVDGDSFYYFNTPDMIVVRDGATNMTTLRSVYDSLFNTQLGLYIGIALFGCFIGFLLLKLVMIRSDKRRYFWAKRKHETSKDFELKSMQTSVGIEISDEDVQQI
jgi:hypothetical protein